MAACELASGRDIFDGHELSLSERAVKVAEMIPLEGTLVRLAGNNFRFVGEMAGSKAGESVAFFCEFASKVDDIASSPPPSFEISSNGKGEKVYRDSATGVTFDAGQNDKVLRIYRS